LASNLDALKHIVLILSRAEGPSRRTHDIFAALLGERMTIDRRAAKAAYREHKSVAGIYAVRCAVTGRVWVGHTPNLDAVQNRIWFTLRQKNHPDAALQRAWNAQGGVGFAFEELERVKDEDLSAVGDGELRKRAAAWRDKLGALDLI
jgi:hypothetical protein